jgi:type IV pilus assembly protein PilQ
VKKIRGCLLSMVLWFGLSVVSAHAQDAGQNSIEAMTVAQQGSVVNVKMTFKVPLSELPSGFSVAKPARIALDFPNVDERA